MTDTIIADDIPLIKKEKEGDFEDASETEVGVDEEDPEGTSIVVSDVSIIFYIGNCN